MKYVVYTHTDYLDITKIHSDHLFFQNSILLINKNTFELDEIYSKFSEVIFYDDNQSYAKKLIQCVSKINEEYFILMHDMDILIDINKDKINEITNYVINNGIDRLYLLHYPYLLDKSDDIINIDTFEKVNDNNLGSVIYRITPEGIGDFGSHMWSGYGVNPSICKKTAMMDIWEKFPDKTYRNIEDYYVGTYAVNNYKFYIFSSNLPINTGHFSVLEYFKYIHITHYGKLLIPNEQMDSDTKKYYIDNILYKYKFNRSF